MMKVFIDVSDVKERLREGDMVQLSGKEGDYEVASLGLDGNSALLKQYNTLHEGLVDDLVDYITVYNGIRVIRDHTQEEVTNTSRYRTQSGKQLYDVLADDLLTPEEFRGSIKKDVYKYVFRYKEKGGIASLEKAKATIDVLIAYEKELGEID
ncbi:DUF3310 domain-containing protein [Bacillus thuringiensis]|nr:DUF3310 domain-containing protein [Bacillus thuringiensis]